MHKFYFAMGFTALFVTIMLPMTVCHALDISISPTHAQRRPNNQVTVSISMLKMQSILSAWG